MTTETAGLAGRIAPSKLEAVFMALCATAIAMSVFFAAAATARADEVAGTAPAVADIAPDSASIAPDSASIAPTVADIAPDSAGIAPASTSIVPASAGIIPEAADIASGTSGTCSWKITSEGELVIAPTLGTSGTLGSIGRDSSNAPWYSNRESIKTATIEGAVSAGEEAAIFYNCTNLVSADISHLVASNTVSIASMFENCTSLAEADLSDLDTSAATESMAYLFSGCQSLAKVTFSASFGAKARTMAGMFNGCTSLASLDFSNFSTPVLENTSYMFCGCTKLASIAAFGRLVTSNVLTMRGMFKDCPALAALDFAYFSTAKTTDMRDMFSGCSSLVSLDLSKFDTARVTDMRSMFYGCTGLGSLVVSSFDTSNVKYMEQMFSGCGSLASLDVSGFDTANAEMFGGMFAGCSSLAAIDVSGFNTSKAGPSGDFPGLASMFSGCSSLTSLELSSFDTSGVADFERMFYGCASLKTLDLASFDTSKATNMTSMFDGCDKLEMVSLGERFTFKGAGAASNSGSGTGSGSGTDVTVLTTLPTPSSDNIPGATGDWDALYNGGGFTAYVLAITVGQYPLSTKDTYYANVSGDHSGGQSYITYPSTSWSALYTGSPISYGGAVSVINHNYSPIPGAAADLLYAKTEQDPFMLTPPTDAGTWYVWGIYIGNATYSSCIDAGGKTLFSIGAAKPSAPTGLVAAAGDAQVALSWSAPSFAGGADIAGYNVYRKLAGDPDSTYAKLNAELVAGTAYTDTTAANGTGYAYRVTASNGQEGDASAEVLASPSARIATTTTLAANWEGAYTGNPVEFGGVVTVMAGAAQVSTSAISYAYYADEACTSKTTAANSGASANGGAPANIGTWYVRATYGGDATYASSTATTSFSICAGGVSGGCSWKVDAQGNLAIWPTDGKSGKLADITTGVALAPWYANHTQIKTAVVEPGVIAGNRASLFYGCSNLASADVKNFDTSGTWDMGSMFDGCSSLASLDLSGFDAASATCMDYMFSDCEKLSSISWPASLGTSKLQSLAGTFKRCYVLPSIDLSGFDFSGVTDMGGMFMYCNSLKSITWPESSSSSKLLVPNLRTAGKMFASCSALPSIDLSGFDFSGVADMGGMFMCCSSLKSITWSSSFDTSSATDMSQMFSACSSLEPLDVSGFDTSKVETMEGMFSGCSSLTSLDVSGFSTSKVKNLGSMFYGCASLASLDLASFDTSKATNMTSMFDGCDKLEMVSLGERFTFKGAGATVLATLPTPSAQHIYGAKGNWVSLGQLMAGATPSTYSAGDLASKLGTTELPARTDAYFAETRGKVGTVMTPDPATGWSTSYTGKPVKWGGNATVTVDGAILSNAKSYVFYSSQEGGPYSLSEPVDPGTWYVECLYIGDDTYAVSRAGASFAIADIAPNPPINLAATAGDAQASLAWEDPASSGGTRVVGYNVYRKLASEPDAAYVQLNTSLVAALAYSDTGLANGTEYTYKVTAVNTSGDEGKGATANAKPLAFTATTLGAGWMAKYSGNAIAFGGTFKVTDSDGTELLGATVTFAYSSTETGVFTASKPVDAGTWWVKATYAGGGMYAASTSAAASFKIKGTSAPSRLWGQTRYDTMQAVISTGFATSTFVVLASGENYPDALSASALAGAYGKEGIPIVLTAKNSLSAQAAAIITSLKAETVFIIGGPEAVSTDVYRQVGRVGSVKNVVRLAGDTRSDTALTVYRRGAAIKAWSNTCIVAYGDSFADALSISPYAYASKSPVFLAEKETHLLGGNSLGAIKDGGFTNAIIVGGTNAVYSSAEAQLVSAGIEEGNIKRLGGENRYLTSQLIAEYAVSSGVLSYHHMAFANGQDFPDALAVGALCGKDDSVVLLVTDTSDSRNVIFSIVKEADGTIDDCAVIGGTAAVSADTFDYIARRLGEDN